MTLASNLFATTHSLIQATPFLTFLFLEECFSRNTDHISQHNVKTLRKILGSNLMVEDNENDNLFFYSYCEKLPAEYELKGVDPLLCKKNWDGKYSRKSLSEI